ncbi:putative bifunctional diguanylate cyclase/phosphodiesterase [Roseibium aggregatum]|uniref:putative bifunctional diguanylate cyclase/phosphodiesterase n=1 Tax=Roseibium aggregatum TaxID=187304 RepID=UPI001AD9005F|nr:bifunctional diguanylate cyclase/phosphodiesterase [Roseibium aggregatum]
MLAPSLLFASLWFTSKFENVRAIDRSLAGLHLVQSLGPLMQEKALTGDVRSSSNFLRENLKEFGGPQRSAELTAGLDAFLQEGNIPDALRKAQTLATSISQLAKLDTSASFETSMFSHLINKVLLSVVIESSFMASSAEMLMDRKAINTWDKMLITVQGGQFKFAADGAARGTTESFRQLAGAGADALRRKALVYRDTNQAYQKEGAKLLTSTLAADTGADIVAKPVIETQPELVRATFALWQTALDYFDQDLQHQRAQTLFTVALAGLVGGLIIVAAFAIAIYLSRALADRTQKEFESLGFHDPLTGLPNRRALLKTIRALPKADGPLRTGLLVIDLRQFKKINDRFGDHNGDSILRDVASNLSQFAEPEDFLSRTGGTEFMLLRPKLVNGGAFETLANRIIHGLGKERVLEGQKTALEANAGLFISQPGDPVSDQILVDAALALRSSKQKGPMKCDVFTNDMRETFEKNGALTKELLKALSEGDIKPWFQPQIDIHTGEVVGAEALARWIDHNGIRYPGSFLPAADEAGYMELIEKVVRAKTLKLAAELNGKTRRRVHLALNMSTGFLANDAAVDALHLEVKAAGLKPSDISLEILEAVMIDETAAEPIKRNIVRLAELGFYIELDDFGTGHSSISSLRDLQVHRVKIDRSFISGVDTDPGLQKFTSALIRLAKSLDIHVLAEGVETEGELEWLKQNGCDVIQGFLISKAVPEEQLAAMILQRNFSPRARVSTPLKLLTTGS